MSGGFGGEGIEPRNLGFAIRRMTKMDEVGRALRYEQASISINQFQATHVRGCLHVPSTCGCLYLEYKCLLRDKSCDFPSTFLE